MTIKFRAWHIKEKRWIRIHTFEFQTGTQKLVLVIEHKKNADILPDSNETHYHHLKDIILEQSTGLFDCKGVEIWEGDIIKFFNHHTKMFLNRLVVFDEKCSQFSAFNIKNEEKGYYNGGLWHLFHWVRDSYDDVEEHGIEVIGNQHDNPELLT